MDVAKIGLGCVTFGREISETESFQLLDYAFEKGINFLDTASAYGDGNSEKIIGKWLAKNPAAAPTTTIASKVLPPYSPAKIHEVVEESLNRLQVSSLDLFYLHNRDASAACPETLQTLDRLVGEGKIESLGVSNFNQAELETILKVQDENDFVRLSAIQNNFNYAVSDMSPEFRDYCSREEIQVITYSPLGAGFLTGKHREKVESGSRFDLIPGHQDVYFHEPSRNRLARLEEVAAQFDLSQAHLALSWAFHQAGIHTILVGGRKREHIDQALSARQAHLSEAFEALETTHSDAL